MFANRPAKSQAFVVIPMRQAGLPAPTSEQNKAWGPDAMDRSATHSIANSSSSSNFTGAPDTIWERIASKTRRKYFESVLFKRVLLRLAYQDCKRTLSPFHRRVVTTYALELGAAGDGDNRDHTFSAFRAPRYSIHEILPITAN
jgi:hypothetical protein